MNKRVFGILVALAVVGSVLLAFFHVWPYSTERGSLEGEVAALLESHKHFDQQMWGSNVAERLTGLHAILNEPDVIDDLETRMEDHCDRSTFVRKIYPGECPSLDWATTSREQVRETITALPRSYSETVELNVSNLESALGLKPTFASALSKGQEFSLNNRAIQESVQKLSNELSPRLAKEYGEITEISVTPFKDNAGELQSVLRSLGRYLVASSKDELNTRLRAARAPQSPQEAVTKSQNTVVWLRDLRTSAVQTEEMGVDARYLRQILATSDQGVREARYTISWVKKSLDAQENCQNHLREALTIADQANVMTQQMGQFDSSDQIAPILVRWSQAKGHSERALASLRISPPSSMRPLSNHLLDPTRQKTEAIYREISAHCAMVSAEHAEAQQQEATWQGQAYRSAGRAVSSLIAWGAKTADQASKSRVARELGLSAKMLVLSTQAFYDMMDPNSDPISWAYRYSGDMEQLMDETDEVMRMDGPSLTGKNTVLEDLVNSAYQSSFDR